MTDDRHDASADADNRRFATTQWSVVLAAGDRAGVQSQVALARLCDAYWYPLYAYVRRRVSDVDEAQDLTQSFFAHLLEKQVIARAHRSRGRFRAFLLTALKNFLANEWNKVRAEKRGGGALMISLDWEHGESRFQIEPVHGLTPENIYERRWVLTLLEQVLQRLRWELDDAGNARQFELFKDALMSDRTTADYDRAAAELGITAAAAKQAAYRTRKRYRQLFREEVRRTVAAETDVDDEIGRLLLSLQQ